MLIPLLVSLVVPAYAQCNDASPCGEAVSAPGPQASAEGATRLAAVAHSKALRAIAAGAKNEARLHAVAGRMAWLSRHQREAEQAIGEIRDTISDLQGQIDRLDRRVGRLEKRQVALSFGAGAATWFGPEIATVYYGDAIPYVQGELGFSVEDGHSGWTLMGTGEYNPGLASPGGGGYVAVYAKNPWGAKRTAIGAYLGADYRAFDQAAEYGGYKAVGDGGLYLRFTADKPRDGFGAFVVVRGGGYYGMAADYTGASAPEFGGLATLTLQGGKFWRL